MEVGREEECRRESSSCSLTFYGRKDQSFLSHGHSDCEDELDVVQSEIDGVHQTPLAALSIEFAPSSKWNRLNMGESLSPPLGTKNIEQ